MFGCIQRIVFYGSPLTGRPISDPSFANDILAGHRPALVRVGAVVAIVAENKVMVGGDFLPRISVSGWVQNVRLD